MPSLPGFETAARVRRFLLHGVWDIDLGRVGALRSGLVIMLRVALLVAEDARCNQIYLRAAALTYKTIFSIVPLLAVMLAFFKGFGGTDKAREAFQQAAFQQVSPGLRDVVTYLNNTIAGINAGAVGGVALVLLLYTAVSLLATVEDSLNSIWRVRRGRSFLWRSIIYWGMVTLGPLVAVASVAATAFLEGSTLFNGLRGVLPFANAVFLAALPILFTWTGFTFLYYFIPNTRVRWTSAIAGGIVAGTLWEAAKYGYVVYNAHAVTNYAVYGALGAIPMFLLWLYLSWILVLIGAEVAYAFQHVRTYRRPEPASDEAREELGLRVMLLIAQDFRTRGEPTSLRRIVDRLRISPALTDDALGRLKRAGLAREVDGTPAGFVPGRDPAAVPVKAVLDAIRRAGTRPSFGVAEPGDPVNILLSRAEAARDRAIGPVTVGELASDMP
jgi:membrane protein